MPFKKGDNKGKNNAQFRKNIVGGRKPDWFKQWCRDITGDEKHLKRVVDFIEKGTFEESWPVWKHLSEVGFGKATQSHELEGKLGDFVGELAARMAEARKRANGKD